MSNVNVNVEISPKGRKVVMAYGSMFGRQLFTVSCVNVDLKFNEKRENISENGELLPIRPVHRYKIRKIDVISMEYAQDIDGTPMIILNKGLKDKAGKEIEITLPLQMPKFDIEPTNENIKLAIENIAKSGEPIYFKCLEKLTDAVNRLNKNEKARVDNLISDLQGQSLLLGKTISKDTAYVREYKKQCGVLDDPALDATVHVETTVEE